MVYEGKTTRTRDGEAFLKSIALSYEDALLLQRAMNAHEAIKIAEVRRDHHAPAGSPLSYYVRFRLLDVPAEKTLKAANDVNFRRALYQRHEMLSSPLPDEEGWYLVVHTFPEEVGGGCTIYRASLEARRCSCPHSLYRGAFCKHLEFLSMLYPVAPDTGEIRKTVLPVSRDRDLDFP